LDQRGPTFTWLRGSPGTGKSTIAKTITADLWEEKRLASAIYFNKTLAQDNTFSVPRFICSIAYQITEFSVAFCQALSQRLEEDGGIHPYADWVGLFEQLLGKPLRHLPPPLTTRWVVVIDGLDECGSRGDLKQLMGALSKCAALPLTFLVTSRPEFEVVYGMERISTSPCAIEDLDAADRESTDHDILRYLQFRIKGLPNRHDPAWPPSKEQCTAFVARCKGLFELAAILLRQFEDESSGRVLSEEFSELVNETYYIASDSNPALHAEYRRILQRAYPQDTSRKGKETMLRYQRVVGTLVLLQQPLGTRALADLLGISTEQVRAVLRPLSSVVAVPDPDDHPISFYHASFPEFLLPPSASQEDSTHSPHHIHVPECETLLAQRCLDIMNSMLVYNICKLSDLFMRNEEIPDLSENLDTHAPAHLRYTALHWAKHLASSGDPARVSSLLHDWCQNKMIFYLELMSLLDRCDAIVPLLNYAIEWAQACPPSMSLVLINALIRHFTEVHLRC